MTTERFKQINLPADIIDMKTSKIYHTTTGNDGYELCILLNKLHEENEQLKKELKRCKDWLNSDKNDYQLTLAFIKNKGYSLKDVLEYEKELRE